MKSINRILVSFIGFFSFLVFSSTAFAYQYPLYPYTVDFSQTMTFKIFLDGGGPAKSVEQVLQYIKEVDTLTRGVPKIAILVGFQEGGHDWQYPAWGPVNHKLRRPQDPTARDSLVWLMKEAEQYHTKCTVHVNCYGAFKSSPDWNRYVTNGWISRHFDGTMVYNGSWAGGQAFAPNLTKMWYDGELQRKVDCLVKLLPPILDSQTLYLDANSMWRNDASPYDGITAAQQLETFKKFAEYTKIKWGLTVIGEYCDIDFLYGFVALGLTWSSHLNYCDLMSVPPQIACGGKDYGVVGDPEFPYDPKYKIFGASVQLEQDLFHQDTMNVLREFTYRTLPYFFMNKHMRSSYTNGTLYMTEGIVSTETQLRQNGNVMRDNEDVFIPEVWRANKEIMAFSPSGYTNRTWTFPSDWRDIRSVDIYNLTKVGPQLLVPSVSITNHTITVSMSSMQGKIVVPAGSDIYGNPTFTPSGTSVCIGVDDNTHGTWKGTYGVDGYDIIGSGSNIPLYATLSYNNSSVSTWDVNTTDARALQKPGTATDRIAAKREMTCQSVIDVNISGSPKEVDVYLLDWDNYNRNVVVDAVDANTQRILSSIPVDKFQGGKYVRFRLSGHILLRVSKLLHESNQVTGNPVFSGVFIGTCFEHGEEQL
jgi:hypothetical protein